MRKYKSKIVLSELILIAALTSCTTTRVATLTKSENETIELFTTRILDRNYVEISYIQTSGGIVLLYK